MTYTELAQDWLRRQPVQAPSAAERALAFEIIEGLLAERKELTHAARLLAKSLSDAMIGSVRQDWGKTNAAVLEHWRAEVLRLSGNP